MIVIIKGYEREFDIQKDGITFNVLLGNGNEKDLDYFLSWEDLQEIFIEERDKNKYKNNLLMSDGKKEILI